MEAIESHMCRCGLEALPTRLSVLIVSTPKQWADSFRYIDKNVSTLLENDKIFVISNLSRVAVSLSYRETWNSLCDFCMGPQFDDKSRQTFCNLLILFSRLAIKLDEPDSVSLSTSLMMLAKDLTKIGNYLNTDNHPVYKLAVKISRRYRDLPED